MQNQLDPLISVHVESCQALGLGLGGVHVYRESVCEYDGPDGPQVSMWNDFGPWDLVFQLRLLTAVLKVSGIVA